VGEETNGCGGGVLDLLSERFQASVEGVVPLTSGDGPDQLKST
jgi:hypothetical protein